MTERINSSGTAMLRLLLRNTMAAGEMAGALGVGVSWALRSANRLEGLGFLESRKMGRTREFRIPDTPLGNAVSVLLAEEPVLNLDLVLGGPSLRILPLLLEPGAGISEIASRTGLSVRAVQYRIRSWRGMGLVASKGRMLTLSGRHPLVINLVRKYSRSRNLGLLADANATLVWQHRDEFLVSAETEMPPEKYRKAGPTRLKELGYDIVSRNRYYMFGPGTLAEAEALVQTEMLDPVNPRPARFTAEALEKGRVAAEEIKKYRLKYDLDV